jgi:hypothetical protein
LKNYWWLYFQSAAKPPSALIDAPKLCHRKAAAQQNKHSPSSKSSSISKIKQQTMASSDSPPQNIITRASRFLPTRQQLSASAALRVSVALRQLARNFSNFLFSPPNQSDNEQSMKTSFGI